MAHRGSTAASADRANRVVIFSEGLAKVAEQYLKKGAKVYVQGKLQTRKWQDKDGNDRWSTEVVLQGFHANLTMLSSANGGEGGGRSDDFARPGPTTSRPPSVMKPQRGMRNAGSGAASSSNRRNGVPRTGASID